MSKGTITKIHQIKRSKNGNSFIRVEFKIEDGRWSKTDLCPNFLNYNRWKNLLFIGNALDNLQVNGMEVNADSYPSEIKPISRGRWIVSNESAQFVKEVVEQEPLKEEIKLIQDKLL